MGKFFNLKEWLTIADTARHLSIVFDEHVNESDVLRLALDGHLRLSIYFVNHVKARCGKIISWDETDWDLLPIPDALLSEHLKDKKDQAEPILTKPIPKVLRELLDEIPLSDRDNYYPMLLDLNIDNERFLRLSDVVSTLRDVWDLSMVGTERLDIEHKYQNLIDGPAVTLQGLDGAFVQRSDAQHLYQLQESYESNEFQEGSLAHLERLREHILYKKINDKDAKLLLSRHKEARKKFLENQNSRPIHESYYPASGLPEDALIVVRTEALREFEIRITNAPSPVSNHYISDKLRKVNQAADKFWFNADRDDRGTHEDNATVAAWLVQEGFSQTLADKAATIIRPEWAPVGRKPEE